MNIDEGHLTLVYEKASSVVLVLDILILCLHHANYHLLHLVNVSLTTVECVCVCVCVESGV